MAWTLLYTSSAGRAIRTLDPGLRRRVHAALHTLRADPDRGKPLQLSLKGLRSRRTGDYRLPPRRGAQRDPGRGRRPPARRLRHVASAVAEVVTRARIRGGLHPLSPRQALSGLSPSKRR